MKKYIIFFLLFIVALGIIALASKDESDEEQSYAEGVIAPLVSIPSAEIETETPKEEMTDVSAPILVDVSNVEIPTLIVERPEQLLSRVGYSVSYNKDTRCPNWVAWHLTKDHADGPYPRKGVPYYDDEGKVIGVGFVTSETCGRGGYLFDREAESPAPSVRDIPNNRYGMSHGHLCPAGDNKWSKAAINQSFLMTNMCPQDEKLNQGDWRILEERCRKWAQHYGDIYIVAGPLFYNGEQRTIGENNISVPDAFFKVVLCLNDTPKALGFIYPNTGEHHQMHEYVYSVDEVEVEAGMNFFANLPDEIEDEVEKESNLRMW